MNKEQQKQIKERIEEIEYCDNGFNHLSGTNVRVLNIKIDKEGKRVHYDCILTEEGCTERFNNCWVSFKTLNLNNIL